MKLIICEKPSQARLFAEALSKHQNINFSTKKGYIYSTKLTITYAIGHLLQLAAPVNYNIAYKTWSLSDLPILPETFKLQVNSKTKEQFKIVKSLVEKADVIYNATDAEREGELIFRYILTACNKQHFKNVKRIWANDLESQTINKAFNQAKDQSEYHNLYMSAKARSEADWLIGINATRALSLAANKNKVLSLGRVQTAVLKLIVSRFKTLNNFVKEPLFTPQLELKDTSNFVLKLNKNFKTLDQAKTFISTIPKQVNLLKKESDKLISQPKLYSLPDLYIVTNNLLNLTATKTLSIAQSLYEKGYISYPRTDSNYLTSNQVQPVKSTLNHLINEKLSWLKVNGQTLNINHCIALDTLSKHFIFNDKKTSDHYAIIPLSFSGSKASKELKEIEIEVLKIISLRFFRTFMPKAHVSILTYLVEHENQMFQINGQTIKSYGHLALTFSSKDKPLPNLEPKLYTRKPLEIKNGFTSPPKLYTEATLISAMRNPLNHDKLLDNSHIDSIKSLGTPATIDNYLPLLVNRNYVTINKKHINPTSLGISVIEQLSSNKITSINLTAEIEHVISKIAKGEETYSRFLSSIKNYTKTLTKHIIEHSDKIAANVKIEEQVRHNCPKCKTGFLYMAKSKRNLYCSNYKSEPKCNFILYTKIAGKTLPEKQILKLIGEKKSTDILQFTNSKKVKYKASIILNDNFKTDIKFNN